MSDPGHAEPVVSTPAEVVSQPPAGVAVSTPNTSPRISDDGNVVVFDSTTPGSPPPPQVMIRDRTAGTTTPVPDAPSAHPGVSGDGCVVAYSVPAATPNAVQLMTVNRCSTGPSGLARGAGPRRPDASPSAVGAALPTPALSFDGWVIAWSTGTTVLRYVDAGSGYALADTIDPPRTIPVTPRQTLVTGPTVDLTSDGTRVVFVAGPGTASVSSRHPPTCSCGLRPPPDPRRPSSCRPRRRVNSVRAHRPHRRSPATAASSHTSPTAPTSPAPVPPTAPVRRGRRRGGRHGPHVSPARVGCVETGRVDRRPLDRLRHTHRRTPSAFHGHASVCDHGRRVVVDGRQRDVPDRTVGVRPGAVGQRRRGGVRQHARRRAGH